MRAGSSFLGAIDHEQQDANLFASWGVDYLEYDNEVRGNGSVLATTGVVRGTDPPKRITLTCS